MKTNRSIVSRHAHPAGGTRVKLSLLCGMAALTLSFGLGQLSAATGTWLPDGNGAWNLPANWSGGAVPSAAGDNAYFDGVGYTVDLGSSEVTVGSLNVTNGSTPTWIIENGTLNLSATGSPKIVNDGTGTNLIIRAILKGSNGFVKEGTGRFEISNSANTITGGITLNGGSMIADSPEALNGNTVTLGGAGTVVLALRGVHTFTSNLILGAGTNAIQMINGATSTFSGTISETGGSRDMYFTNTGTTKLTLSGNNSYSGNTSIGSNGSTSAQVVVTSNNALGTGVGASVSFYNNSNDLQNALILSGDVTISDKNLTLKGRGAGQDGSLQSSDGDNTWDGNISLGTGSVTAQKAAIGVAAESTLTIEGVISNPVAQTQGLAKVGDGTLILNGVNTYTTGTVVSAGTLLVNGSLAATGTITVEAGATLGGSGSIGGNTTVNSDGTLTTGSAPSLLTFGNSLTLSAGSNSIIRLAGAGGASPADLIHRGTTYDALNIGGILTLNEAVTFTIDGSGLTAANIGDWYDIANWATLVANDFDVQTGFVFVNLDPSLSIVTDSFLTNGALQVIPEPSTYAMLLGGLLLATFAGRRRARA